MVRTRMLVVAFTSLLFGHGVAAGDYTFTTGVEYTTGDYGTDIDTSSWYIPLTIGYTAETFAWGVTVPYIRVDGSDQVTGIRTTPTRSPGGLQPFATISEERVDSGLGDVILSATYQLQEETPAAPWLGVRGKVKLGTADEAKNLGTGENDYAIQFEAAKGMFDGFIGYNFLGDTETVDYDDIFYGAGAITLPLRQAWRTRAELYLEESALSELDEVVELTLSLSSPLTRGRYFSLYAIKGFSDTSPDWGVGTLLSHGF